MNTANTFHKVSQAIALNFSIDEVAAMLVLPKSTVKAIAESLDDPEMAYQMQIEQNFFDNFGI